MCSRVPGSAGGTQPYPPRTTLSLSKKLWASRVSSEVNKEVKEEEEETTLPVVP